MVEARAELRRPSKSCVASRAKSRMVPGRMPRNTIAAAAIAERDARAGVDRMRVLGRRFALAGAYIVSTMRR